MISDWSMSPMMKGLRELVGVFCLSKRRLGGGLYNSYNDLKGWCTVDRQALSSGAQ